MSTQSPSTLADDVAAQRAVPQRVIEAWARHDAEAFAETFAADGTLILPGIFLSGREEIRAFMAKAFAGPYAGTRVTGEPIAVRQLGDDVAVLVTLGGVLPPGASELTPERTIRATWLLTREARGWRLAAYQNTPAHTA